ncbi:hypothetical protein CCP3SC15_4250002 [Gammaproteobacteria bacterium]
MDLSSSETARYRRIEIEAIEMLVARSWREGVRSSKGCRLYTDRWTATHAGATPSTRL